MTITNDYTDDFIQRVREQAAAVLLEAGFLLQTTLKGQLSTSYPPASIPGQYPHGRTWTGRDAVMCHPSDLKEIARLGYIRVGFTANAWYMPYLELEKQRLGIFHTFDQLKPAIENLLAGSTVRTTTAAIK
jgi:hypothetical protein